MKKWLIVGVVVVIVLVIIFSYYKAKNNAKERLKKYTDRTKVVETSYGKITYIDEGKGEVILSVHGICGGYDQAYDSVSDKVNKYRIIAPARFGYEGSDMPQDATIEMQVEAFVQLLDALEIDKTYILATSAGSATAIKFAMMYPDRVKGLLLYCSGYPSTQLPEKEITYAGPPAAIVNDFVMWFFSPLFGPLMGMDRSTIEVIMPLKDKKAGIVFDAKVSNTDMYNHPDKYDMTTLQVPVLCFHAKDDKMADYETAWYWGQRIPDCRFVSFETGGHLMEGNTTIIEKEFDTFVLKTK